MASCRWGQSETPGTFGETAHRKYKAGRYTGTLLPPEVHFQVSKKIAQLTKVIFTLNARLDEQESVMEALKQAYEDRLQQLLSDSKTKIAQYKVKVIASNELQQKLSELESLLHKEKKSKEELEATLKTAEEQRVNGCKTCGHLPNGAFLKSLKKEFDSVKSVRKKEEELEIIERILRKKPKEQTQTSDQTIDPLVDPLGVRVKRQSIVIDIPEKDTQQRTNKELTHQNSAEGVTQSSNTEVKGATKTNVENTIKQDDSSNSSTSVTSKGDSAGNKNGKPEKETIQFKIPDHKDRELQTRLSECQKEMLRLQVEIKKMERAISRKDDEIKTLKVKATDWTCESVGVQTEVEVVPEPDHFAVCSAKLVERELRETLNGLRAVSSALKQTQEEVDTRHRDLTAAISRETVVLSIEQGTQTEPYSEGVEELGEEDSTDSSAQNSNEKSKEQFKERMSELLEQVALLMTNGDLCGGNMSDAEKECAELKRVLREKEEKYRKAMAVKDKETLERIAAVETEFKAEQAEIQREHELALAELIVKHQNEMESNNREAEMNLESCRETIKNSHDAQLKNFQDEVAEMSRRLQSQTELQTAEMTRLNHELNEALQALRKRDEDAILRELNLTKALEDERLKVRSCQEQLQQTQKQHDLVGKQLDLKRDEVLQVRREATQQIRNLENYWLEKVNQELSRIRRSFAEEKKNLLDNFCKSQRLLKDKITALQIHPNSQGNKKVEAISNSHQVCPNQKEAHRLIRRDSVKSELDMATIQEDEDISFEDDSISASQPNVAYQPTTSKKERILSEQRFIKRAESVLLPKLQFLSFWKSASSLDKAQAKKQRSVSCNSAFFPVQDQEGSRGRERHREGGGTPEIDQRKRSKMSPTFYRSSQAGGLPQSVSYVRMGLQDSRSSSCFNLNCKIGGPVFGNGEVFSVLSKSNKRNSLGSTRWLGVVPESRECDDNSSNSDSEGIARGHKKLKEPLLESEL